VRYTYEYGPLTPTLSIRYSRVKKRNKSVSDDGNPHGGTVLAPDIKDIIFSRMHSISPLLEIKNLS